MVASVASVSSRSAAGRLSGAQPRVARRAGVQVFLGDALRLYRTWPAPVVIVSDGAYGVSGFPGDTPTPDGLVGWYRPHVEQWSSAATGETTLWFWNTEVGWATVHPLLLAHGWEYVGCNIWDKGIAHVSGNTNSKTLRRFPVVTEICAQYVKRPTFKVGGRVLGIKEWLRWEWERSGLPLSRSNEACGVRNAATRKYLTKDHVWYFPPPDAFQCLADFANAHGHPDGMPYFSLDGRLPLTASAWARMRSKFKLRLGITNVWSCPAVRGEERVRRADGSGRFIHANQKPRKLTWSIIDATSEVGDVVWEPFGGLCTAAMVCADIDRACYSAEVLPEYYAAAVQRLRQQNLRLV